MKKYFRLCRLEKQAIKTKTKRFLVLLQNFDMKDIDN